MFENDSILSFQGTHPRNTKPKKMAAMGLPAKSKRDDFIMDTNNSSIVSKRSVEKLYYAGQPEYFRYFVKKFQRRSPLINRGYWLRMKAVDQTVRNFLNENNGKKKVVVNLGCGYDPLPFEYLGKHPELCNEATFVDVDYPQLMEKKHQVIMNNAPLHDLMPDLKAQATGSTVLSRSEKYLAVGCDLRELEKLELVLRTEFDMDNASVSILFFAEVSVAYMTLEASDAVLKWSSKFDDVRFCLLEQHLPDGSDHPFAQTMLKHFEKLRTPLHAVGTMDQMYNRFASAGWPTLGIDIRSLWELWSDPEFLSSEQRQALDKIEPFDEWEEFALFGSHYFLMVAHKTPQITQNSSCSSSSPKAPKDVPSTKTFRCLPFEGEAAYRRFAAILPSPEATSDVIALHGGLGTRERLTTCDVYTDVAEAPSFTLPQLSTGLMCHTITTIKDTECLLVGGRTAPDKASAACWLRKDDKWTKVHDLPEGRYRHNAVAINSDNIAGVIVFGGKNSQGQPLNDWLFWTSNGWTKLDTSDPTPEPRFGAAMALRYGMSSEGFLTGGMKQDGTIINDYWHFEVQHLDGRITIALQDSTTEMLEELGDQKDRLGRFGATIVSSPQGLLLIGGVAAENMLTRLHEILDLDTKDFVAIDSQDRPLLVGFSAMKFGKLGGLTSDILIVGGGSTCFSFGTYWSTSCVLRLIGDGNDRTSWHLHTSTPSLPQDQTIQDTAMESDHQTSNNTEAPLTPVVRKSIRTAAEFELVRNEGKPCILTGLPVGFCTSLWTNEYLKHNIGDDRSVVVHASPSPHMNFQSKNFAYKTQTFGSFLDEASAGSHLYLRALSTEKPSEKPTNLAEDFPSIAEDFQIPEALTYVKENAHSSPLRVSGPVTMWLHYDVMANIYVQVKGTKRLLIFPPTEVTKLSFAAGASSSTLNPFTDAHNARGVEAVVSPGDILFIPPLWLHCAEPTSGLSVAVNVFFREKNMEPSYAAGRDVYGNRDLAAYERGRRDVQRVAKSFEGLPRDVKGFYLARLAQELKELASG